MRIEDAPPAGWYPDPEGNSRLRWWEGTDWSDRYRAPRSAGAVEFQWVASEHARSQVEDVAGGGYTAPSLSRRDSDEIINQVRLAARAEVERAADLFSARAQAATRNLTPLITQYTSKIVRWFRILSVVAIVLLVGWIAFQVFAQVSLFEWIGDRIDNLTDEGGAGSGLARAAGFG